MLNGFSLENRNTLSHFLDQQEAKHRKIAVFDCDGTLWHGDVGEAFFQWQIKNGLCPNAPKKDPWGVYFHESTQGNASKAYGWLAQWNHGTREEDLLKQCEQFFDEHWKHRIFEPMRELTSLLQKKGFETWAVSGSMKWIVQAGVRHFGFQRKHVIGASSEVENGIITEKLSYDGVVPYRDGKAKIVKKLIPTTPTFAGGNTYWDKELLETADGLKIAIHSEIPGEINYPSEQKLKDLALERGWLVQQFSIK